MNDSTEGWRRIPEASAENLRKTKTKCGLVDGKVKL